MTSLGLYNQAQNSSWILAGDFNVITDSGEKREGWQLDTGAIQDFQNFIHRNMLIDAGFTGEVFTWCNNGRSQDVGGIFQLGFSLVVLESPTVVFCLRSEVRILLNGCVNVCVFVCYMAVLQGH